MLELSFSLQGQEIVHRRLGISAEGVKSFKQPLDKIGGNFMKAFDLNFSSRGSLYGGWAPRKPQFRAGRRVDTWPLMEKTGRMRKSFNKTVTSTSLTLGNSAPYFVYHQSNKNRTRLPRRMMMKIRQQEATMIVKTFQAYLVEVLRRSGGR